MTPEDRLPVALDANQHTIDPSDSAAEMTPFSPEPVCWRYLNAKDEAAELETLGDWVRWFVRRYCLDPRTVPPCWARHGALVEELSALRTLWELCYADDAAPADPHTFHHHLSHAISRLQTWTHRRNCRQDQHNHDLPPQWVTDDSAR